MDDKEFSILFDNYLGEKRRIIREKYDRVLPSGEYLFNRFDKAEYLNCGKNSSVYDSAVIMGDVEIGDNVWVGPCTILEGSNAKLRIGDYVSIDAGVCIYTHDSTKAYVSGGKEAVEKGEVTIGSCTVIGTMSMIGYGVTIGDHCVVGAHSFVNKSIPDNCIAAGVPANIIGEVIIKDDGSVEFKYF